MSARVGDTVYVRVRITGQAVQHGYLPMLPVEELDGAGKVLASARVHPDAIVTPQQVKTAVMTKGEQE